MSRRKRYTNKELDELQKMKYENQKLKKQVSSLRRQLSRVDIDRYENLKDLLYKQSEENLEDKMKDQRKRLKKEWECHECRIGFLSLHTLSKMGEIFYYRKCTNCSNRTKTKPYTKNVKGIKNDE